MRKNDSGVLHHRSHNQALSHLEFTDDLPQPVFLDDDNRQFVLDDGTPVYGIWVPPDEYDAPIIVELKPG